MLAKSRRDGVWRQVDEFEVSISSEYGGRRETGIHVSCYNIARSYHEEDLLWRKEMRALEKKYAKSATGRMAA